jgi:hypothetical protein
MKEFDKIIRSKMHKAEAPYPSDMWQRIQQNLPEKKRKTYPVWLYLMVLLFAISGLGLWAGSQWWGSQPNKQPDTSKSLISGESPLAVNNDSHDDSIGKTSLSGSKFTTADVNPASDETNKRLSEKMYAKSTFKTIHKSVASFKGDAVSGVNKVASSDPNSNIQNEISKLDVWSMAADADEINGAQRLTRRGERINTTTIPSFLRVFGTDQSDVIEEINSSMKKTLCSAMPKLCEER